MPSGGAHTRAPTAGAHGPGFGGRVGFGSTPAIVVVDFIRGFTDPSTAIGIQLHDELAACRRVLDAARTGGVPVVFTNCAYDPSFVDAGLWRRKIPAMDPVLDANTHWVEVDDRLGCSPLDLVLTKKYASGFFGTALQSTLQSLKVDTVIVTGCSTSGCVRATVVDAISHGYHTIVVGDAVGDRAPSAHEASLSDIDAKYGDVVPSHDVLSYLQRVGSDRAEAKDGVAAPVSHVQREIRA